MAIEPGSDLLSDALAAAEPQRAKAAAQRLAAIAAKDGTASPSFDTLLAAQQSTAESPAPAVTTSTTASPSLNAVLAAQPQAMAESPGSISATGDTASFNALLATQPQAVLAGNPKILASLAGTKAQAASPGKGDPYEQLETTMLKTFFELMLPLKADAVFGSGFAGSVWKSMFAQALASASSHANITGVARALKAKARHASS